jgi:two-component system, response regulator
LAEGYDVGVNSYIRKPFSFDQFVTAISQLGIYWLVLNEEPPKVKLP